MTDIQTFWESYGVSTRLRPHGTRVMLDQPTEPFPEAEIHQSVTNIEIEFHGDMPNEAFIKVTGISEDAVYKSWIKTAKMIREHWKECWPDGNDTSGSD